MLPLLGREFMPALEEGNLWIRGTAPLNISLERHTELSRRHGPSWRPIRRSSRSSTSSAGPTTPPIPTATTTANTSSRCAPRKTGPRLVKNDGWFGCADHFRHHAGPHQGRDRRRDERGAQGQAARHHLELLAKHPRQRDGSPLRHQGRQLGQDHRPRSRQAGSSGHQGQERLCNKSAESRTSAFSTSAASRTSSSASIPIKCQRWGVQTADVNNVVQSALGAKALSQMVEGEKLFDISVRWPKRLRNSETDILDIPVDIVNNTVVQNQGPGVVPTAVGTGLASPSRRGLHGRHVQSRSAARRGLRLRDLVSPVGDDGSPDPEGQYRAARRLDDLSRAGQAADRDQVQRPRSRSGRRRGRGPRENQAALRSSLPRRLER